MKADIEIYTDGYGWSIKTCSDDPVSEKAGMRDQWVAIFLGWGMTVDVE